MCYIMNESQHGHAQWESQAKESVYSMNPYIHSSGQRFLSCSERKEFSGLLGI